MLTTAEEEYKLPKSVLPPFTDDDYVRLYEDPIICSILGHFFQGFLSSVGHSYEERRTVSTSYVLKLKISIHNVYYINSVGD